MLDKTRGAFSISREMKERKETSKDILFLEIRSFLNLSVLC
jgi:hypothetical protein